MKHILDQYGQLLLEGITFLIIMTLILVDIFNGGIFSRLIGYYLNGAM